MMTDFNFSTVPVFPHHLKQTVSGSRAKYREGKKDTAVKVYTINQESVYLLITGIPAVGAFEELRGVCDQYGVVEDFRPIDDYPTEHFTDVYLVKYKYFPAARAAKKCLDDRSFFGGNLHVFYAPEFESIEETRLKLQERRKYVAWKTKQGFQFASNTTPNTQLQTPWNCSATNKFPPPGTAHRMIDPPPKPVTYIWAGKEYTMYPESSSQKDGHEMCGTKTGSHETFLPRQLQNKTTDNTLPVSTEPFSSHGIKRLYAGADKPKHSSLVENTSYTETISNIRAKLFHSAVPNTRISLKRKRRL